MIGWIVIALAALIALAIWLTGSLLLGVFFWFVGSALLFLASYWIWSAAHDPARK
jgi:hypothetical protein